MYYAHLSTFKFFYRHTKIRSLITTKLYIFRDISFLIARFTLLYLFKDNFNKYLTKSNKCIYSDQIATVEGKVSNSSDDNVCNICIYANIEL